MPITAERMYNLLDEHEIVLYTLRELYIEFKQITRAIGPAELKLSRLDTLIETVANPPDKFALIERANYNRNAKENLRQREKQRRKRRANGAQERPLKRLGSYTEIISAQSANGEDNYQLTPQEEAQLRQLKARKALPLAGPTAGDDQVLGDDRMAICLAFFKKEVIVSRGEFTEFCTTNGFNDSIDYFLGDMLEKKLIKRQEDGTYLVVQRVYDAATEGGDN